MKFLGMGGFEFVIILIVVLLIFGPKNLPKLGKSLGKTVSNLRSGMNEGRKKQANGKDEASEKAEVKNTSVVEDTRMEIEGEVEEATEDDNAGIKVASDESGEDGDGSLSESDDAAAAVEADKGEPASSDTADGGVGDATKKVKRVVKKKVVKKTASSE